MQINEAMLERTRAQFGNAHRTLPVARLSELYNEAEYGVPPLLDPRYPDSVWKDYVRKHGFAPTGPSLDTPTDEWKPSWANAETFADEIGLALAFVDRFPPLSGTCEWLALAHVGLGVRRHHTAMIATELEVRPAVLPVLREIARHWYRSELSADLSQFMPEVRPAIQAKIAAYRAQLAPLGLDWSGRQSLLMEALYPIDATQAALERLAAGAPDLASIAPAGVESAQPVILLLAMNSD